MSDVQCMKCGAEVPQSSAYIEEGGHICVDCFTAAEVEKGFATPYKGMGMSALSAGLLSICFNPFSIFSLLSIFASIGALRYPNYLDQEEKQMLRKYSWVKVVSIIALVIAVPRTILTALMMLGIFASL
ncbi:MAG: hypothetical protein ACQEVA_20345 [Myxococcota bacterium]